jgi:mitotic spindle assembly checkpoint protein MAD2B
MATSTLPTAIESHLNTYADLAASFTIFFRVFLHQVLFLRLVYPRTTFLPVRVYNYPVQQSRHPKVCEYINDVAVAVEKEILKGIVAAVTVIIFSIQTNQPMERYVLNLSEFPKVPVEETQTVFEGREKQTIGSNSAMPSPVDLDAQFRASLARLASSCERLTPLSKNDEFGFTVCIEVREDAQAPVGITKDEQAWIVAEPRLVNQQSSSLSSLVSDIRDKSQKPQEQDPDKKVKTVPIRRVEAGELRLELWVEESRQKLDKSLNS